MSDYFGNLLLTLDAVFPVDTRTSLERPGLSPQPKSMGDAQRGTLRAGITELASRPADSITLSNGQLVLIELVHVDDGIWSAKDRERDFAGGWGGTREEAISDLRSILEDRLVDPI